MKRKTATKLLSCLLSLLMVVGLLSAMGIPAYAAGAAWDADQTFDSDSMIRGGVTVSDNIELTINGGVTVTVYGGIDARGKTLTVSGSGTLIVYGADAFIGNMTVNSDYAKVYAYGGTGGNGADRPDDIDSFSGTPGGNGGTGGTAIMGNVTVIRGTVTVIGGRGGNGGRGADVYSADTGRGFGRTAGVGGNGGTGGTGIKGDVTVFSGTVNVTGGIGGTGGEGGFAWGGTNGKGGNGANGGVAVDGTVTVNGGNVYMASDNGGEGGINGRDPYGDKIKTGADGNLGRAVTGAIGNDRAQISESNDNKNWSVISSSSSEKPYVHVITPVSVTDVVLDKTSAAVDEGSALALTAVLLYNPANNRVKWSVDSEGVDKVLLYADAECSNVIGSDETDTLKVYVKGRLPGTAKVTVTSVADSSLSATCDITVRHIHDFNYFVSSDDTITATCKSDHCPEKQGDMRYSETLTIVPPTAQPVYDGTAYPATFADGKTAFGEFTTLPAIEYRRYTEQAVWSPVDAPIDAGRYRASITLQPASGAQITAWVEYTIDTAAMDVSVAGWEGTYDGDEHAITVTVNVPEGTQIAYRIADSGEYDLTENPNFTDAGTHKVYYRVTNPNYTAVEGDGTVQIDKATLTDVMVIPLGDLTYTGQEQTQKVFTNAKSVNRQPVAFTYSKTPDGPFGVMPTVTNVSDSGTYYYMASAPNHHDVTGSFTVTMQKYKVPQVTAPTLSAVTYDPNRTLSHISLPTNWAWANDSTVPTVENTGYDAALTVDDANNDYTEIEGYDPASHSVTRTLRLTVNKAEVTPPVILGKPYTGERQFADVSDTEFYTVTKNEGGITVGRYDVVLTLKDSANYRWTTSNEASITLDFRIEYIIVPTANPVTYDPNQTLSDVPLELDEAYDKEVWDWKWVDPSIVPVVNNTGYQVVLEKAYDDVIRTISLTVYKANPTVIEPTRKDLIYNGQAQELVNAGSTVGGTLYYAVTTDNTAPADTAYTTSIPTGTDAGTYYVWYKVVGDENYNDTEAANITVTITDGPRITGADLVLDGSLGFRFHVALPAGFDDDNAYMSFTVPGRNGREIHVSSPEPDSTENEKIYACPVYALEMAKPITAVFHYGDEKTLTYTYSVQEYLETFKSGDDAYALAAATRNYGHYIQPYLAELHGFTLGENTYPEMSYASAITPLTDLTELVQYARSWGLGGHSSNLQSTGFYLSFNESTTLNIRLQFKEAPGDISVSVMNGEANVEHSSKLSGTVYEIAIPNIAANNLGATYHVVVTADGAVVYDVNISALSYVYAVLNAKRGQEGEDLALTAFYNYYVSSKAYEGN